MAKKVSYLDYYSEQSGQKRFRLNELVIWAVNKLQDTEAHISGTKLHLEDRLSQLVKDIKVLGWRQASARFRKSVDQWCNTHSQKNQKELSPSMKLMRGL